MRDPKEPGDNYNHKEHVYHDSNIVQGLPDEQSKDHVKDSKQKISNKSKKKSKKNEYDKPVEQTVVKKNQYAEPHAHETTTEASGGKDVKQKSRDSSAARSGGNSRGSLGKDISAGKGVGLPEENRAPKRRELISAPNGIDVEAIPITFVENETGESSGIQLISKKDLGATSAPVRKPTLSALTRKQTWKEEDSFGTTNKVVVTKKPRKQQPEVPREVKHFRRNALIITLFLATILIIVAVVVACLIVVP